MQGNATMSTRVIKDRRRGKHCETCRVAEFEFLNDCPIVQFPHKAANAVNNFRIEIVARCETQEPYGLKKEKEKMTGGNEQASLA
jgi:hypothetical protein